MGRRTRTSTRALFVAAALLSLSCDARAAGTDYQRVIDDCYFDSQANESFSCYFTSGKLRGRWSPRDCVIEAAIVARDGNRISARGWLKACACGDSTAQEAIEQAGDAAVEYAVSRYGAVSH
jgi:hypothetical protein